FLNDRKIDMIISGGVNIYPAEIEKELASHPKVGDVAVFGIPHEDWGEEVKAVIEPADGVEPGPELAAELEKYCRERLAGYKVPKSFDFTDDMPRDDNGKLYKRKLRDPYWAGRERAIWPVGRGFPPVGRGLPPPSRSSRPTSWSTPTRAAWGR